MTEHFFNLLSYATSLAVFGERFSVFIYITDHRRIAPGGTALCHTDPGRAWHPVGD
jgi:hypothetical protein